MTSPVREERTGWRDLRFSARHRGWGYNCPALDLDFLLLEFDQGRSKAIVEYKHEDAQPLRLFHPSIRALADLGARAQLPVFATRYADDFSWWWAQPLNARAGDFLPDAMKLTEAEWVRLLYRIRGLDMPADLFQNAHVV